MGTKKRTRAAGETGVISKQASSGLTGSEREPQADSVRFSGFNQWARLSQCGHGRRVVTVSQVELRQSAGVVRCSKVQLGAVAKLRNAVRCSAT